MALKTCSGSLNINVSDFLTLVAVLLTAAIVKFLGYVTLSAFDLVRITRVFVPLPQIAVLFTDIQKNVVECAA